MLNGTGIFFVCYCTVAIFMDDNQIFVNPNGIMLKRMSFISPKIQHTPMFKLHFVSNNKLLYHDTLEAIYQYVYTLYHCNSNADTQYIHAYKHTVHFFEDRAINHLLKT